MMTLWAASGQTSSALIGGCLACKPRAPAAPFLHSRNTSPLCLDK